MDSRGNVYIADNQNSRVRKVDTSGVITTIASTSTSGITTLFFPEDVAVDAQGHVLIADYNNMRVIKL